MCRKPHKTSSVLTDSPSSYCDLRRGRAVSDRHVDSMGPRGKHGGKWNARDFDHRVEKSVGTAAAATQGLHAKYMLDFGNF